MKLLSYMLGCATIGLVIGALLILLILLMGILNAIIFIVFWKINTFLHIPNPINIYFAMLQIAILWLGGKKILDIKYNSGD